MSIPSSGSSTSRSASTTSCSLGMAPRLAQTDFLAAIAREEVDAVDEANPVAARAHDEGMRARRVRQEADAVEQVAVRDAGCRNDHLLRREVVDREHPLGVVDAVRARFLDLGPTRRPELRLQLAAEAAERSGGEHRLPRAADPDREVIV